MQIDAIKKAKEYDEFIILWSTDYCKVDWYTSRMNINHKVAKQFLIDMLKKRLSEVKKLLND